MRWAEAYGNDLSIPSGKAEPRPDRGPEAAAAAPPESLAELPPSPAVPAPNGASDSARMPPRRPAPEPTKPRKPRDTAQRITPEPSKARVMFVGELSGAEEGESWRAFESPAGQLLKRIIVHAMGLRIKDVAIADLGGPELPADHGLTDGQADLHRQHLERQVEDAQPEVIVCLGKSAAQMLLGTEEAMARMREARHEFAQIPVVVTWHPAHLLREPARKRETWDDIKQINRLLGLPEVPVTGS